MRLTRPRPPLWMVDPIRASHPVLLLDTGRARPLSGNAGQFVRTSLQYLYRADDANFSVPATSFTIALWVNLDSHPAANSYMGIVAKRSDPVNFEYALIWRDDPGGTRRFGIDTTGDGSTVTGVVDATMQTTVGNWAFVVAGYDLALQLNFISVDDGAVTTAAGPAAGVFDGNAAFEIGRLVGGNYLNGRGVLLGFWKRRLTAGEITQLYNSRNGLRYYQLPTALKTNLVEYYEFQGGANLLVGSHAGLNLTASVSSPTAAAGPSFSYAVDGDPVSKWLDISGYRNDPTPVSLATTPVYKINIVNQYPVVRFDGTDDVLAKAFTLNQPCTVVLAADLTNLADTKYLMDGNSANTFGIYRATNNLQLNAGSAGPTVAWATGWHVLTVVLNGAASYLSIDGTKGTAADAGAGNPGGITLGAKAGGSLWGRVDIATGVVAPGIVSWPSQKAIERQLAQKYGIALAAA